MQCVMDDFTNACTALLWIKKTVVFASTEKALYRAKYFLYTISVCVVDDFVYLDIALSRTCSLYSCDENSKGK